MRGIEIISVRMVCQRMVAIVCARICGNDLLAVDAVVYVSFFAVFFSFTISVFFFICD